MKRNFAFSNQYLKIKRAKKGPVGACRLPVHTFACGVNRHQQQEPKTPNVSRSFDCGRTSWKMTSMLQHCGRTSRPARAIFCFHFCLLIERSMQGTRWCCHRETFRRIVTLSPRRNRQANKQPHELEFAMLSCVQVLTCGGMGLEPTTTRLKI